MSSLSRQLISIRPWRSTATGWGFETEGLIGTEFKGDESIPDGTTAVFHLDGGLRSTVFHPPRERHRFHPAPDGTHDLTAAGAREYGEQACVASCQWFPVRPVPA